MIGEWGGLVMTLVISVLVLRRRRAALAVHPAGIAASIVLFLPDRHAMLHFVDDETTGIEGFSAMHRTHADPHSHVAQRQRADAMDAQRVLHRESPQGFRDDALTFLHGEFLKGFVLQTSDFLPLVVVPHPTLEGD